MCEAGSEVLGMGKASGESEYSKEFRRMND